MGYNNNDSPAKVLVGVQEADFSAYKADNTAQFAAIIIPRNSIVIATNDASQREKNGADIVLTGSADQDLINTAIASLPNTSPLVGGSIRIGRGNVSISSPILTDRSCDLSGVAGGTRVKLANSSNCSMLEYHHASNNQQQHAKLQNMIFLGNLSGNTGVHYGIDLCPTTEVDYVRDLTIENVWVDSMQGHGIGTSNAIASAAHHVLLSHCSFEHNALDGVNINTNAEITLYDVLLYGNMGSGFRHSASAGLVKVTNCHLEANAQYGLVITSGNVLTNYPAGHVAIIGNKFYNNATYVGSGYSQLVAAGIGGIYMGNTVTDDGTLTHSKYGIEEGSAGDYNIIANNIIKTTAISGNLHVVGTHTVNANNISI